MTASLIDILRKAWDRRADLRRRTDAFRLLNGAASGTPGLAVDVFSGWPVVYAYAADLETRYPGLAGALREVTGASGAALKDRSDPDESGRDQGGALYGEVPETVETEEAAPGGSPRLRFAIHLRHPRNVGLFLDTRPLRERLMAGSSGAAVLNLFSYSCSLGLAAAAGGAASVANVDVSARYLGWGKENLRLSGLSADKVRFHRMDGEEYLDWAARKGRAFDAVILDPPSFSRADGKTFGFEKDYFRLLGKAAALLAPGGSVYAVTNFGGIDAPRFRSRAAEAIASAGRAARSLVPILPPEDFDPGGVRAERGFDGAARGEAREGAFHCLAMEVA